MDRGVPWPRLSPQIWSYFASHFLGDTLSYVMIEFTQILYSTVHICFESAEFLRATCQSIFHSIPRILDVLTLVCLYILMFAVLGYVLFSEEQMGIGVHVGFLDKVCDDSKYDTDCDSVQEHGNVNFDTLFESYLSLCVLMSTANFPDVMMPSFHESKWAALFFAAFIAFGLYYLMSIIFAVIYHHYHSDNAEFVKEMTNNRARSLDFAFQQMVIFSKEADTAEYELNLDKQHQLNFNEAKIYFPAFYAFMYVCVLCVCVCGSI